MIGEENLSIRVILMILKLFRIFFSLNFSFIIIGNKVDKSDQRKVTMEKVFIIKIKNKGQKLV